MKVGIGVALVASTLLSGCGGGSTSSLNTTGTPSPQAQPTETSASASVTPAETVSASAAAVPTHQLRPTPTSAPSTMAPVTAPPSAPHQIRVRNDDSGRTVAAHVGDRIVVDLAPELGNWTKLVLSDSGVVRQQSSAGGYPSDQPLHAVLLVTAAGSSDVSSTTDNACLHAQPRCGIPQKQWVIHVIVT